MRTRTVELPQTGSPAPEAPRSVEPLSLVRREEQALEVLPPETVPELALKIHRALLKAGRVEQFSHTVHLFGSAGIAAFGWAVCRLLGVPAEDWVPLWFCAGLLIYNLDRLRRDPADAVNTPLRERAAVGWRWLSLALAAGGALGLVLTPFFRHDWTTLVLIALASPVCLHYSIPYRGRRLKDVPYLKSFFAPTVVLLAIFGLPLVHTPTAFPLLATPLIAAWAWGLALANMLLCDVRDVAGDRGTGVLSLPAEIGLASTRQLVVGLALVTGGLAALLIFAGTQATRGAWMVLAILPTLYVAALALAVGQPRSERFYERWVEGILFLPALVVAFFL